MDLARELGSIDVYLFDQIQRGGVVPGARVLDAGCGVGRNLPWFWRNGCEVFAFDVEPRCVARTRELASEYGAPADDAHYRAEPLETCTFPDGAFDLVICNAVLHFARDTAHFEAMVRRLRALVAPSGRVFCRLASTIGLDAPVEWLADRPERWGRFPDGNAHFLVDLDYLLATTAALDAELCDPIKTVNVQHRRCMTTWVWRPVAA